MRNLIIILIVLVTRQTADAGIDLRNGNYFVTYTDIAFRGSKADITRSYNSRTSTTGLFGYGWGTLIETKLCAMPDGTLILKWWGSGLGDYYEPAVVDKQGLYAMVNAIIRDLIATKKLDNNPVAIAEKKSYYLINNKERAEKYISLQDKKVVPVYTLSAEKKLHWLLDVNQVIQWNGKYFSVKSWDDQYEFNSRGQLSMIKDKRFMMQFSYTNNKLLQIIVDSKHTCRINTDSSGKITRMAYTDSSAEKTAIFKYDSLNNLVYSKDVGDNEYWFSYDLYHNMTRIDYSDKRFVEMTYDPASNRIIKFRDKGGSFNTYQYPYFYTPEGKVNYDHYATRVQKYDSIGKLFFTQYKEYENRRRNDGSNYLHRMIDQTDTSYNEAIYKPEVGNAYYRKKNNKIAWADYDSKKRPVYLSVNDTVYRSGYTNDLPGYFLVVDSLKKDSILYKYMYDKDGRLAKVLKNEVQYFIEGSKDSGAVKVSRENIWLKIKYVDEKPYSIENYQWGKILIPGETTQPVSPDKRGEKYIHSDSTAKDIDATREIENVKKINRIKEFMALNKGFSEQIADRKEDPEKLLKSYDEFAVIMDKMSGELLKLYYEFQDILEPKKIAHEWIWEKL